MQKKSFMCPYSNDFQISIGDYISVKPEDPSIPLYIGRVQSLYEDNRGEMKAHVHWFWYGHFTSPL